MTALTPPYTTVIAPVGRQPMAVLLPILEYAPAATYLIPTRDVHDVAAAVSEVARAHRLQVIALGDVDPYRPEETRARCAELLAQLPGGQAAVNLSGGTTMMAMGAQQAARDHTLPMLYVNTDDGEIIHLAHDGAERGRSPIAVRVSIADYAAAHGAASGVHDQWSTAWSDEPRWSEGLARQEPYLGIARAIGALGDGAARLLGEIRKGASPGRFALSARLSAAERELLARLVAAGLLTAASGAPESYATGAIPHAGQFLTGHWLEIYVADACVRSGLFDEVRSSVQLRRDGGGRPVTNELDVVVTSRGRLAAASCKTGREAADDGRGDGDKRKLATYELDALLQADLMGLYARKALVTSQPAINRELRNRAYHGQICCIPGSRLPDVAQILRDHLDRPQLEL